MLNRKIGLWIICCVGFASAAVAQPFSKSMAECAAIYAFGRDYADYEETVFLLEFGQAKWMNAAIVQAQNEGVSAPADYVATAQAAKYEEWKARGITAVFTEEFGDWLDYCRAFAQHRGIDLDPN